MSATLERLRTLTNTLTDEEEMLRDYVWHHGLGVVIADSDLHVRFCSDTFAKWLGYDIQEILGEHVLLYYSNPKDLEDFSQRMMNGDTIGGDVINLRAKDGTTIQAVLFTSARLIDGKIQNTRCTFILADTIDEACKKCHGCNHH